MGSCWVFATIIAIENDQDWWYLSCKKCPKKVNAVGTRFYCEKCDRFDITGNPRFKIQVRVIDGTGSASLLMWDRECIQLIGKNASDLKDEMVKNSADLGYPSDIEALVDRKILFKIQIKLQNIKEYNDVFTVMRLTVDDDLISKHVTIPCFESQDSTSENEVSTPNKTPTKQSTSNKIQESNTVKRGFDVNLSTQMSSNKTRRIVKEEKN
ncbi:Nucleic acid-binding [Abeliophyllum distichum]|uniref:Nucleic acid-binding n=1 Tax=Abeliophyllum distichum TaxID=126358 RepID=A0ABD1TWG4_9LAMI